MPHINGVDSKQFSYLPPDDIFHQYTHYTRTSCQVQTCLRFSVRTTQAFLPLWFSHWSCLSETQRHCGRTNYMLISTDLWRRSIPKPASTRRRHSAKLMPQPDLPLPTCFSNLRFHRPIKSQQCSKLAFGGVHQCIYTAWQADSVEMRRKRQIYRLAHYIVDLRLFRIALRRCLCRIPWCTRSRSTSRRPLFHAFNLSSSLLRAFYWIGLVIDICKSPQQNPLAIPTCCTMVW